MDTKPGIFSSWTDFIMYLCGLGIIGILFWLFFDGLF